MSKVVVPGANFNSKTVLFIIVFFSFILLYSLDNKDPDYLVMPTGNQQAISYSIICFQCELNQAVEPVDVYVKSRGKFLDIYVTALVLDPLEEEEVEPEFNKQEKDADKQFI